MSTRNAFTLLALLLAGMAPPAAAAQDKSPEKLGTLDTPSPNQTPGRTLQFSGDGKRVLFCGQDGVHVWNVSDGTPIITITGNDIDAYSAEISPDGKTVAVIAFDVKFWNVDNRELKGRVSKELRGSPYGVAFSKDGARIAVGTLGNLVILAAANLQLISDFPLEAPLVAFHPDGKTIVIGTTKTATDTTKAVTDPILYVDLKTGKVMSCPVRLGEQVASFALPPDGSSLVTVSKSPNEKTRYSLKVWDPKKRKELKTLDVVSETGGAVHLSPDGKLVGMGGSFVTLWSFKEGTRVLEEVIRKIPATHIAFGPGGLLATWFENKITLWRLP